MKKQSKYFSKENNMKALFTASMVKNTEDFVNKPD